MLFKWVVVNLREFSGRSFPRGKSSSPAPSILPSSTLSSLSDIFALLFAYFNDSICALFLLVTQFLCFAQGIKCIGQRSPTSASLILTIHGDKAKRRVNGTWFFHFSSRSTLRKSDPKGSVSVVTSTVTWLFNLYSHYLIITS